MDLLLHHTLITICMSFHSCVHWLLALALAHYTPTVHPPPSIQNKRVNKAHYVIVRVPVPWKKKTKQKPTGRV